MRRRRRALALQGLVRRPRSRGIRLATGRVRRLLPRRGCQFHPARLALDSPMAITCLAERAPCLPSRTCSTSSRTYSPACADGDLAFRTCRVVFFSGKATVHRRRAAFSLSVFPIWRGAVLPEHLRSPGGIGHIGPFAFVKTRSPVSYT